jgi:hypothetical protein
MVRALPSFYVIGPPRTGTSWLHEVLSKRTILPHPTKETRFFDVHFQRGIDWYRAHFPKHEGLRPVGEIAPTYFASSEARERIARVTPTARIVCIFRNPVERIQSLYRVKRAYGMIPWNFEQAIVHDPELMESGRYATHLKEWQRTVGGEMILPTIYEDLRENPQSYVDQLADFIEVPRFQLSASEIQYVHASESMTHPRNFHRTRRATAVADWFKARRLDRFVAAVKKSPLKRYFLGGGPAFSEIPEELSLSLYDYFRGEVEELETMLNRDLSAWKALEASWTSSLRAAM